MASDLLGRRTLGIALLGFGTVGQGVMHILQTRADAISRRTGYYPEVKKVLMRNPNAPRDVDLSSAACVSSIESIVSDPEIDLVIEVMGGVAPACEWIEALLKAGKHVITANKAVLAAHGDRLVDVAKTADRSLAFEASVAGGIPLIRAIRDGLSANRIQAVYGIINGTSNYILTEMAKTGSDFAPVLKEAQRLGYAEADPSFDVDGIDAAHKLVLLIRLCFGLTLSAQDFLIEGIRDIDRLDIQFARDFGYAIRSLAIARRPLDATTPLIDARVQPVLVPLESMLAKVDGAQNAAVLSGEFTGDVMLYGAGAGRYPTASAVVSDVIALLERMACGYAGYVPPYGLSDQTLARASVSPAGESESAYYLRFTVLDRPHVLETISKTLAEHGVSIASVYQPAQHAVDAAPIAMLTHRVKEKSLQAALFKLNACDFSVSPGRRIPVEPL